jgi:hypothetical protein
VTVALIVLVGLLAVAIAALGGVNLNLRRHPAGRAPASRTRRVLFPFVADALSQRVLDAALRIARAEEATLVPVFLARVSLHLPLDTPLPRQSAIAIPLQEAIEHHALTFGIPVDARIERGRTYRHALRETILSERYDRIVIAAAAEGHPGFNAEDVAWLLENAPGEIIVVRPDQDEPLVPAAGAGARHVGRNAGTAVRERVAVGRR